jgi:hypothetical protein
VLLALQELEREDVLQLLPIEVYRRAPIEVIQCDAFLEASLDEMLFEGLLLTSLDLVGEQQRQERGVVEVLRARQRESLRQRRHQPPQLQPLEQTHQVRIEVHVGTSPDGVITVVA